MKIKFGFIVFIFSSIVLSDSKICNSYYWHNNVRNNNSAINEKFTVTWKNYDDSILEVDTDVPYNSMPEYNSATPTRSKEGKISYCFKGWDKVLSPVTNDITYIAQYSEYGVYYNVDIACNNCFINGKKKIHETRLKGEILTYKFQQKSSIEFSYPDKISFVVSGLESTDYIYDCSTGVLKFELAGDTVITTTSNKNSVTTLKLENASSDKLGIKFTFVGTFAKIDWGDGEISNNVEHYYNNFKTVIIKIYGDFTAFNPITLTGGCYITKLNFGENITSILDNSFCDIACKFDELFIGKQITYIGEDIFRGSIFNSIVVDSENLNYDSRNNCNAIIETKTNHLIKGLDYTKIPSGITKICKHAFSNSKQEEILNIPSSVIEIGDEAFDWVKFKQINFEADSELKIVGSRAFNFCKAEEGGLYLPSKLEKVCDYGFSSFKLLSYSSFTLTLPESLTYIGIDAFGTAFYIPKIIIPKKVEFIACTPFYDGGSIEVDEENKIYDSRENCNAIIQTDCNKLIFGLPNATIPDSVLILGKRAFIQRSSNIVPKGIKEFETQCFINTTMTNFTFPENLEKAASDIFAYSNTIEKVIFNKNIKEGDECLDCTGTTVSPWRSTIKIIDLSQIDEVPKFCPLYDWRINESLKIYVKYNLLNDYKTSKCWEHLSKYFVGV